MNTKYIFNSVSNATRWMDRVRKMGAEVSRLDCVCSFSGGAEILKRALPLLLTFSGEPLEGEQLEAWDSICESFTYHCPVHHDQAKKYLPPSKGGRPQCPICNRLMAWVPNGGTEVPIQTIENLVGWGATQSEVEHWVSTSREDPYCETTC